MTSSPDESFEPRAATARINQANQLVQSSRRWHVGSMVFLGCASIAYYAMLAVLKSQAGKGPNVFGIILVVAPAIVVTILVSIRAKHPLAAGRALLSAERTLGNVYMATLLPAGLLAELTPYPFPAVLMGLIPAVPCFAAVWRAARR